MFSPLPTLPTVLRRLVPQASPSNLFRNRFWPCWYADFGPSCRVIAAHATRAVAHQRAPEFARTALNCGIWFYAICGRTSEGCRAACDSAPELLSTMAASSNSAKNRRATLVDRFGPQPDIGGESEPTS